MNRNEASASLRLGAWLAAAWFGIVALSAVGARDRVVWSMESALPFFFVAWLSVTARSFPLSRPSYALVFVFLALHQLGAHYGYPHVPLPRGLRTVAAAVLGSDPARNPYDRILHLAFGLFLTLPLREVAWRLIGARRFWHAALPVCLIVTVSVGYELIEWAIAVNSPRAGDTVLGAQGDRWDTHWDLLLATIGGIVATLVAVPMSSSRRAAASTGQTTRMPASFESPGG